ncbi:Nitroreductase [Athelia psychrophila]|uniref:Nitroreductase n=1 Tax=Athelia psychrophila TaxID=1759441 RepID=A0A166G8S9_9AGAM|nr:Nitroreductase [Fibularhizoctonia sp. CBS 109695]
MAPHFPVWSQNATGMLQFTVWTALEAEGFGASLQHHAAYADEISSGILSEFGLPETWKCTALLPFGGRVGEPGQPGREKTFKPIGERVRVINDIGALQSTQQIIPPQPEPSTATSTAFLRTVKARRTYYGLSKASPISDAEIRAIVESAVTNVPSAFNSQTSRAVVVTGKSYQKLWEIVRAGYIKSLGDKAPAAIIQQNEAKIGGYAAGYGTVLFFEDQATIDTFAAQIPAVAAHFPVWSQNATGMLQFTVWTALEAEGLGASLQHHAAYTEEIASGILAEFDLPKTWKCTALLPFGVPLAPPGAPGREKTFMPIAERVRVIA